MSDTPRTDAHNWHDGDYDDPLHAFADFAKQLERELNATNQGIKRLEEAGDAVAEIIGPPGSAHWADEDQVDAAWNNWRKAKEAKP